MEEYWTVSTAELYVMVGLLGNVDGQSAKLSREEIYVRDGRKLSLFYHERCFSGTADPRTQAGSSYREGKHTISEHAPMWKGRGKWSVFSYGYSTTSSSPLMMTRRPTAFKTGTAIEIEGISKSLAYTCLAKEKGIKASEGEGRGQKGEEVQLELLLRSYVPLPFVFLSKEIHHHPPHHRHPSPAPLPYYTEQQLGSRRGYPDKALPAHSIPYREQPNRRSILTSKQPLK